MVQAAKCLLCKREALSSNPRPFKTKQNKTKQNKTKQNKKPKRGIASQVHALKPT
jgi:hypothetical protein